MRLVDRSIVNRDLGPTPVRVPGTSTRPDPNPRVPSRRRFQLQFQDRKGPQETGYISHRDGRLGLNIYKFLTLYRIVADTGNSLLTFRLQPILLQEDHEGGRTTEEEEVDERRDGSRDTSGTRGLGGGTHLPSPLTNFISRKSYKRRVSQPRTHPTRPHPYHVQRPPTPPLYSLLRPSL